MQAEIRKNWKYAQLGTINQGEMLARKRLSHLTQD
jgi:hypothetical protein